MEEGFYFFVMIMLFGAVMYFIGYGDGLTDGRRKR